MNRNEEANQIGEAVLTQNPNDPQAAFLKASLENKKGNYDEAILFYEIGLSKDKIPVKEKMP